MVERNLKKEDRTNRMRMWNGKPVWVKPNEEENEKHDNIFAVKKVGDKPILNKSILN